jgi:predicted hydrocarbon binding protein
MDLDEAIQHAKDVALQCSVTDPLCSAEHAEIAAWLEELREKRVVVAQYEKDRAPTKG